MADSVVIIVMILGILSFGLAWGCVSYAVNPLAEELNRESSIGALSEDTVKYINYSIDLWQAAPLVFLLGLCLFVYERAKGTDLTPTMFYEYEILLVVGLFISILFVWVFGMTADMIFTALYSSPVISNIAPAWDSSDLVRLMLKMLYYVCLFPAILASILYLIFPVTKQTDNTFFNDGSEDTYSGYKGEGVTEYNPQQFM